MIIGSFLSLPPPKLRMLFLLYLQAFMHCRAHLSTRPPSMESSASLEPWRWVTFTPGSNMAACSFQRSCSSTTYAEKVFGSQVSSILPWMSMCSRVTSHQASVTCMMHVCVVCFPFPEGLFRSGLWRAVQRSLPLVRPNWLADRLWRQIREICSTVRCNPTSYCSRDADVSFPSVRSLIPVLREIAAVDPSIAWRCV